MTCENCRKQARLIHNVKTEDGVVQACTHCYVNEFPIEYARDKKQVRDEWAQNVLDNIKPD